MLALATLALCAGCANTENVSGQTGNSKPAGRVEHAMAYDAARGTVVMFGGAGTDDPATWGWTGMQWKQLASSGPQPREDARMVYDAARQVIVLYGGRARTATGMRTFTDTWEWNGTNWTKAAEGGPEPRTHAAMGYDPASRKVLLYGGSGAADEMYRDTWSWNGTAWTRIDNAGPEGRYVNGMVALDGELLLGLVYNAPGVTRDGNMGLELWRWNASSWAATAARGVRFSPMMPMVRTQTPGQLMLYAGWDAPEGKAASTWLIGAGEGIVAAGASPGRRKGPGLAYDAARGRVVMFGGESATSVLADTWEWYDNAWHGVP